MGRYAALGSFATGLSQRQLRAWSTIPLKAEVLTTLGLRAETAFTLTLQSEYPTATQQE